MFTLQHLLKTYCIVIQRSVRCLINYKKYILQQHVFTSLSSRNCGGKSWCVCILNILNNNYFHFEAHCHIQCLVIYVYMYCRFDLVTRIFFIIQFATYILELLNLQIQKFHISLSFEKSNKPFLPLMFACFSSNFCRYLITQFNFTMNCSN